MAEELLQLSKRSGDNLPLATLVKACPVLGRCLADKVRRSSALHALLSEAFAPRGSLAL